VSKFCGAERCPAQQQQMLEVTTVRIRDEGTSVYSSAGEGDEERSRDGSGFGSKIGAHGIRQSATTVRNTPESICENREHLRNLSLCLRRAFHPGQTLIFKLSPELRTIVRSAVRHCPPRCRPRSNTKPLIWLYSQTTTSRNNSQRLSNSQKSSYRSSMGRGSSRSHGHPRRSPS
jgi:hypothetical protein